MKVNAFEPGEAGAAFTRANGETAQPRTFVISVVPCLRVNGAISAAPVTAPSR